MSEGYGFGAEGGLEACRLVRACKVMAEGLPGGTCFMEDYTYNLDPADPKFWGPHMLEVCPSICRQDTRPAVQVHPRVSAARMILPVWCSTGKGGKRSMSPWSDMGNRFRLVLNEVTGPPPQYPMPRLPVARVLWTPFPILRPAWRDGSSPEVPITRCSARP
jgi:L-arabinose isomerase